jgi:hypothetical protein
MIMQKKKTVIAAIVSLFTMIVAQAQYPEIPAMFNVNQIHY